MQFEYAHVIYQLYLCGAVENEENINVADKL